MKCDNRLKAGVRRLGRTAGRWERWKVKNEPKIDHRMMWRKYRWERGEKRFCWWEEDWAYLCFKWIWERVSQVGSGFSSNFGGRGFSFLKFFFKVYVLCFYVLSTFLNVHSNFYTHMHTDKIHWEEMWMGVPPYGRLHHPYRGGKPVIPQRDSQ